ncbi:hypothetical protein [Brachybacterium subflavum]|uniref:hypothetical protein n=1 Tax=Brachybacterium subflavum TaxID=2585206 RepID=UPI0012662719|nr:hypothetical protein [Brachybacterium subflavum]
MTINESLQHVPLDAGKPRFSRRTLALLPGVILAGATALRAAPAAQAAPLRTFELPTPTLSGFMTVGKSITVNPGKWPAGTKLTYEWYYFDGPGRDGEIKDVHGPTLHISAKYVDCSLGVFITATKPGYEDALVGADTPWGFSVGRALRTATPTISGSAKVGSKLTAKPGTWTSGTKFSYQWKANGVAIKGATKSTFTVTSAQIGKPITVTVKGTKSGYSPEAKTSKATAKVPAKALTAATPKISGTARVGRKLTAKAGTWTSGTKLAYQWYASGTAIKGATKPTLTLATAQKGKQITVKVTGTKSGYATTSKTSAKTSKIAAR